MCYLAGLTVVCGEQEMIAYLEYKQSDSGEVTLLDIHCNLENQGNFNTTHLWFNVPFNKCMTKMSTQDNTITYQNSIVTTKRRLTKGKLILRDSKVKIPFWCLYPDKDQETSRTKNSIFTTPWPGKTNFLK